MLLIELQTIQRKMLSLLEEYTGCTIVPSNTTKQMPPYPYISYTLIDANTRKGTYAAHTGVKEVEGEEIPTTFLTMPLKLKYSLTVQSESDMNAFMIALLIKDFFEEAKRQELADNGVIVADVGGITPRDNMLTIDYEYRKGLDVTLTLNNVLETADTGEISNVSMNDINLEKE